MSAKLVSKGFSDDEISRTIRALLPEEYNGDTLQELPEMIASAREKGFGQGRVFGGYGTNMATNEPRIKTTAAICET